MAPGGSAYENVCESHIAFSDYGIVPDNPEFISSPYGEVAAVVSGKLRMPTDSAVHDLLECPVCMNLMYPPILQVSSDWILVSSIHVF